MWVDTDLVMDIAKPIIGKHFPNYDGIKMRRDSKTYDFHIEVCITESDYIADLLVSDKNLDDIAREVMDKLMKMGYYDDVTITQTCSVREWTAKSCKNLVLAC